MLRDFERQGLLKLQVAPGGRKHADWLDMWLAECATPWALFVDSDIEFLDSGWLSETLAVANTSRSPLVCEHLSPSDADYVSPINGVHLSLAARPSPWFLLLDADVGRQTKVSFAGTQLPDPTTGDMISYDVGGRLLHELRDRGHEAVQVPASIADKLVHYGGLSWLPGGRGVNRRQEAGGAPVGRYAMGVHNIRVVARQARKMAVVRAHLRHIRRQQGNNMAVRISR
jgi:hypothetical protein